MNTNIEEIRKVAKAELEAERLREAIDAYKKKLKEKKWFHRLFPYRIVFIKKENL